MPLSKAPLNASAIFSSTWSVGKRPHERPGLRHSGLTTKRLKPIAPFRDALGFATLHPGKGCRKRVSNLTARVVRLTAHDIVACKPCALSRMRTRILVPRRSGAGATPLAHPPHVGKHVVQLFSGRIDDHRLSDPRPGFGHAGDHSRRRGVLPEITPEARESHLDDPPLSIVCLFVLIVVMPVAMQEKLGSVLVVEPDVVFHGPDSFGGRG